jgi:predicted dehydrogenase
MSPRLAFGANANSRITVGMVGQGGRGAWIAEHLSKHSGFQIAAVADYFPAVADSAGERWQVPKERRFSGLNACRRLLESKVDAVFLETPPYFFPSHARAAVDAGCHVYMAKPVAVDVPGCLDILEAGRKATRTQKVFLVDFQTRTDPFHIEAIRRVREGMLGKVGLITPFYHDDCFPDPSKEKTIEPLLHRLAWCNDHALGGAYIVNCDIHALDVALWIAGEVPESAVGFSCRNRANAVHDSHDCYAISYNFKNRIIMSHQSEHVANGKGGIGVRAYGQKAHLEANYSGKVFIRGVEDGYADGESKMLYADGMKANVDTFHQSIMDGNCSNPTLEPSVNSTLASLLGREAALRGRKLTWDELLKDTQRLQPDLTGLKA